MTSFFNRSPLTCCLKQDKKWYCCSDIWGYQHGWLDNFQIPIGLFSKSAKKRSVRIYHHIPLTPKFIREINTRLQIGLDNDIQFVGREDFFKKVSDIEYRIKFFHKTINVKI